jgi:hypothetical protein
MWAKTPYFYDGKTSYLYIFTKLIKFWHLGTVSYKNPYDRDTYDYISTVVYV